jgi:gliding motility-associated-like protein
LFLAGKWRFKQGIFIDTLINAVGCDSILQTETVLFPNLDSSASVFLCNEDSVIFKGKTYLLPTKILERLKDKNGCDSVFQLSVRNSSVTAKFSVDSANRPEFIFINESSKDSAINWKVDQEKQDAPAIPFQYKFEPKGQYHQVCLEAINSDGCKDTFCVNVYASKIAYKLYNVFTPNADGKNDLLAIDYIGGNFKYDVAIFNRWGELIYEAKQAWASDPTQLWNGKVNNVGAECPSGTYFALFNFYIGEGSKPIFTEIPVTLIRTP